jgi:two-component system sensor histidine kinase KdpD
VTLQGGPQHARDLGFVVNDQYADSALPFAYNHSVRSNWKLQATRWIVCFAALGVIVTVYHVWLRTTPTTVALTLLLLILLIAAQWGLRFALFTALAATACFNFFFLPPIGTFTIADTQNWVALFAFLATAVIGSQLSSRIRREAEHAHERQQEVETLFRLSRELLQIDRVSRMIEAIPGCVAAATGADDAALYLSLRQQLYATNQSALNRFDISRLAAPASSPSMQRLCGEDWHVIPLHVGVKPRGFLLLKGPDFSAEVTEALGGLVSIAIDRADALDEAARSKAAEANERLRTELLDSITHEFRTPLTAIKASASGLLSTRGLSEEVQKDMLTVIDEESDRLDQLITQAVQMAQIESEQVRMHQERWAVKDLIGNAIRTCASALASHPVRREIPSRLPLVTADPVWIERVLCNLLTNAAKYSPPGSLIVISAREMDGAIEIAVRDHGPGIDEAEQALIFEKFYRGRNTREKFPGSGIGLAISRAIVRAHGGVLRVQSQPGQGSTFAFSLAIPPAGNFAGRGAD